VQDTLNTMDPIDREILVLRDFEQAIPVWRDVLVDVTDHPRPIMIAARELPAEAADKLWESLPAELQPMWSAVSGRPLSANGSVLPTDLQPQANVRLKSDFHKESDGGAERPAAGPAGIRRCAVRNRDKVSAPVLPKGATGHISVSCRRP